MFIPGTVWSGAYFVCSVKLINEQSIFTCCALKCCMFLWPNLCAWLTHDKTSEFISPRGISKFLTQDSRKSIYRSFIAANFNYCPISWVFWGKKNTSKLEKLQERALRLVFCDQNSSYDDLLKRGNFLSLKAYRIKCLAVEVFKCVHGFHPTYIHRLFTEPLANYNLRDRRRLNQPRFHTYTYGFRSFRYSGSKLWNSLPRAIKSTNDINEFKRNITEWCQTCDSKLEIF